MTFPPLVERELRGAARRPGFYWLRGVLALVAVAKGYELLNRFTLSQVTIATAPNVVARPAMPPPAALTGADLLHELAWLMFCAALLMGLLAADSISRERREGTLGLLLLTDLTPRQIVLGKMLSCGLTGFAALLGFMPVLTSTVLAGGVSVTTTLVTGLGLVADLFVALAAGLWMSAVFRQRHYAILCMLGLVGALTYGAVVLGGAWLGAQALPVLSLLSLAGWATAAWGPPLPLPVFAVWFILTSALGWFFVRQAERTLAENWRDEPHEQVRKPEPPDDWTAISSKAVEADASTSEPARVSRLTDPRPWDADPVRWRVERLGSPGGMVWFAVLVAVVAQFSLLESVFDAGGMHAGTSGGLVFGAVIGILGSSGLLAWAGARFFHSTRRQQDLELLLTTPVGGRDIVASQWRVLRRTLVPPLALVMVPSVAASVALAWSWLNDEYDQPWFLLPVIMVAVNLIVETVALCWVGMHFGLRARNAITAVCATIGLVQMIPVPLAVIMVWSSSWLADGTFLGAWFQGVPAEIPVLLFLLGKNVALIVWARLRLRRDLRPGRRARMDVAARRLVLQPA